MHAGSDGDARSRVQAEPIGRLTIRPEFLAVGKDGRRVHSGRMTVQGRRRDVSGQQAGLRVGLTVTKREGHSTERNRIRRRLRAAVAMLAETPLARETVDLVVVGRREALSAPFPALVADLHRALDRLARPGVARPAEQPDRT